jgi:hypothetical protein
MIKACVPDKMDVTASRCCGRKAAIPNLASAASGSYVSGREGRLAVGTGISTRIKRDDSFEGLVLAPDPTLEASAIDTEISQHPVTTVLPPLRV